MMGQSIEDLFMEYKQKLDNQIFVKEELDYSILDKHIVMLEKLNVVESSSISIFDLYKRDHLYLSSGFEKQLGWNINRALAEGHQYTDSFIHPVDLVGLLEAGNAFLDLAFNKIPKGEIKNYKMMSDYRVQNSKNNFVRVIEQHVCLECDTRGNIWLDLSIMDISPDQDLTAPFRCRAMNYKTGELYEISPTGQENRNQSPLSGREKEVLKLIAEGLVSKQIADKLFISVNTVNTHRQRIIEKLNVSNTAEAIRYAMAVGWL